MFTGEKPDLLDICPLREDSIYVVGKDGIPQHYDGEDWTPMRTENANPLMGIWAAHEKDIYAVGVGGVVIHFDGKDWKPLDTGNYVSLNSVYGYDSEHLFTFGVGDGCCFGTARPGNTANPEPSTTCSDSGEKISNISTRSAAKAFTGSMTAKTFSAGRN